MNATDDLKCFDICCLEPCEVYGQIIELLPPGPAHEICEGSQKEKFWKIVADIEAESIKADCQLLDEAFPCTANDLLPDWERFFDVSCFPPTDDIQIRRNRLCAILSGFNLTNCEDYVKLAALFGFTVCCEQNICIFKGVPGTHPSLHCMDAFCPDVDIPAPAPIPSYWYPDVDAPDCLPISCATTDVRGAHAIHIVVDPVCSPALFPNGCEISAPDGLGADCIKPDCAVRLDDLRCIIDRLKPRHLTVTYSVAECVEECPELPDFPTIVPVNPCLVEGI